MVSIYKRGKKLYLKYTVGGKTIQKSTKLDDTPANRRLLKAEVVPELERRIASGELEREMERKRIPQEFSHYADKFLRSKEHLKTYREVKAQVEIVVAEFGDRKVEEITRGECKDFAERLLRTLTPKTVRKYLNVLGAIFDEAIDYRLIDTNPAKAIRLPSHEEQERDPFSAEEVDLILSRATGWFRNYLAVAFYTGARPGEILALRLSDIDLKARTIRIERSVKNGVMTSPKTKHSVRTIPIFDSLMPYLRGQMMFAKEWLFENEHGTHFTGSRTPRHHWTKLIKELGIPFRDMYSTRHTFITHILMTGELSILEIAKIVGHKNASMIIENYARFIDNHHLKIGRQLDPFVTNQVSVASEAP